MNNIKLTEKVDKTCGNCYNCDRAARWCKEYGVEVDIDKVKDCDDFNPVNQASQIAEKEEK